MTTNNGERNFPYLNLGCKRNTHTHTESKNCVPNETICRRHVTRKINLVICHFYWIRITYTKRFEVTLEYLRLATLFYVFADDIKSYSNWLVRRIAICPFEQQDAMTTNITKMVSFERWNGVYSGNGLLFAHKTNENCR